MMHNETDTKGHNTDSTGEAQSDKKKKWLSLALRLVISFGLIGYFVYSLAREHGGIVPAFNKFADAFSGASVPMLLFAGSLHMVGFLLVSLRWQILLSAQGPRPSYGQLFIFYIMSAFFNTFLPSTIGGDTVRALEAKGVSGNTTTSVMVILVERLTGLAALILIAGTGLVVQSFRSAEKTVTPWMILAAALGCLGTGILLAHPRVAPRIIALAGKFLPEKIRRFMENAYSAVETYYRKPGALLLAEAVSVVFQLNMVFYFYLLARALGQNPQLSDYVMKVPVVIFLLMTVPAINGLGVRTASFQQLMHFPKTYALSVETLDIVFRVFYGLVGGVIFLFYKRRK